MKITPSNLLGGLALACLALAGSSGGLWAQSTNTISTFDSDLRIEPFGTNFWRTNDPGTAGNGWPTAIVWTNSGAGGSNGAMLLEFDWAQGSGNWSWEDKKVQADMYVDALVDMGQYDYLEFDALVNTNVSQTNYAGDYGGIAAVVQSWAGWGRNPTNPPIDQGYHTLGSITLPTTNNWASYRIPTLAWPWVLGRLTFQCYTFQNTNMPTHTEVLIDNVRFTSAGRPPRMLYTRATRGLNVWAGEGQNARNSIQTVQDGSMFYMWPSSGGASYSFTVGSYPTDPRRSNLITRMYLIPETPPAGEGAADWNRTNCVMMDLWSDTNGFAYWMFRWKTNAPGSNGQYYDADAQILLTNPTVLGKWTLAFAGDNVTVTMTAPSGNSTNFVMGVHPNVPNISPAFLESGTMFGVVRLGLFSGNTNMSDMAIVYAGAQLAGGISQMSNNWALETTDAYTNNWLPVGATPVYLVPTNNAWWLTWTIPDGGFELQTNSVNPASAVSWSTNHLLPPASLFRSQKTLLLKPGDLPNSSRLFFRMSRPGY